MESESPTASIPESDPGRAFVIRRRDGSEWTVLVSECDYERVMSAGPWSIHKPQKMTTVYVVRTDYSGGAKTTVRLHSFITGFELTDHVNGIGTDNRRSNLRPATATQNARNKRRYRNNTSGKKGVDFRARLGMWRARIQVDGKPVHLGYFDTDEEAFAAYCAAAVKYFGQFARFE